ncbi:MAG: restriction endonuclease subunit M [Clostridia bacterium]|nr:restriction endonuclease subunit M [Clostridia bacterium]
MASETDKKAQEKQTKSKERVRDHGEVFTAEREVKAMCDLVKDETERIDSRFLEPACGNGNFLAEILTRKLAVCKRRYKKSAYDYERNSLLALGSIYGVDILTDNAAECRARLYEIWNREYRAVCKKECNDDTRASAKFILSRNIVCGNALTLNCVDENGNDTTTPIVFSEWTFPRNDALLQRTDYTFTELLQEDDKDKQQDMFTENDGEGKFLKKYITHYRRLQDNE